MNEQISKDEVKQILAEQNRLVNLDGIDFELERKNDSLQREKNNTQLILKEWDDVIRMRRKWSNWLLVAIFAIITFDFFIIICVGFRWMTFEKGYIVPFFIGESLIKTLGLALIVVKFLFNEKFIFKK